jgi:hypothetical protein
MDILWHSIHSEGHDRNEYVPLVSPTIFPILRGYPGGSTALIQHILHEQAKVRIYRGGMFMGTAELSVKHFLKLQAGLDLENLPIVELQEITGLNKWKKSGGSDKYQYYAMDIKLPPTW